VGTLGESALGWYSFGENQAEYFGLVIGTTIAQIALPAMAAMRDRIERLGQIYIEMLRLAATISVPMQIGAGILADLGIRVFLGDQWLGAVPVFRAYLVLWLIKTLLEIGDAATSATGRPDVRFAIDLAQLPFCVAGIWLGLRVWGGIIGVAWSLTIVRVIVGLVYLVATIRITQLTASTVLRYLSPSLLAGLLMGSVVYAIRSAAVIPPLMTSAGPFLTNVLDLTMLTLIGVVCYFTLLYTLDRTGFKSVATTAWQIMLPQLQRR
jgi:O-antigen/teichoic acid export membrane protein